MLDFTTKFGRRAARRLQREKVMWLTTVDSRGGPQPRPVWFHWDGQTLLVFSQPDAFKLRHIRQNPRVSANFNASEDGEDVVVLLGEARLLEERPAEERTKAYLRKYREGIKELGMTADSFRQSYAVPILITPAALRGF